MNHKNDDEIYKIFWLWYHNGQLQSNTTTTATPSTTGQEHICWTFRTRTKSSKQVRNLNLFKHYGTIVICNSKDFPTISTAEWAKCLRNMNFTGLIKVIFFFVYKYWDRLETLTCKIIIYYTYDVLFILWCSNLKMTCLRC